MGDDDNPGKPAWQEPNSRRYHYVWFGKTFPTMNRIAVESCLRHCPNSEVILWHSDPLEHEPEFRRLLELGVSARPLQPEVWFGDQGAGGSAQPFDAPRLRQIWDELVSHVTRSNLARAAILYHFGGVYLDIDVLVLQDLAPLLQYAAFLGMEHIVWPDSTQRGLSLQRFVKSPLLDVLRKISVGLPGGEQLFLKTKQLFPRAVNGAILGAKPGHALVEALLRKTAEVPRAEWQIKHRLGTHVLQRTVEEYTGTDLEVLPPACFYPLGPVISRQYFRKRPSIAPEKILQANTYAIHWYASVSDLSRLDRTALAELTENTVFGRLCAPYL